MSLLRSLGQLRLTYRQLERGQRYSVVTAKIVGSLSLLSQKKSTCFHGSFSKHSSDLILCKTSIIFTGKVKVLHEGGTVLLLSAPFS